MKNIDSTASAGEARNRTPASLISRANTYAIVTWPKKTIICSSPRIPTRVSSWTRGGRPVVSAGRVVVVKGTVRGSGHGRSAGIQLAVTRRHESGDDAATAK
jgi:hypothetical protein